MGRDKLSQKVGGQPLIQRVAEALSPRCDEIILAGPAAAVAGPFRRVEDVRPGEGPLAGLEAGLSAARNPLVFAAAGDMPFVSPDLVSYLLDELARLEVRAVVPRDGERMHPLCAAYERAVLPRLVSALDKGVRSAGELVGRLGRVAYVGEREIRPFGDPGVLLMNVNAPEDLRLARELADR